MGKSVLMLKLFINLLWVVSFDCVFGFGLFLLWKYLDLKYFSTSEIALLKEENKYLREENKKINGSSSEFWEEGK